MDAKELLISLTERQVDSLFRAASTIPTEKLAWAPSEGSRSALDQLQEVATAPVVFWKSFTERKIEWSDEAFANWKAERSKITTLEELEKVTRESTAKLVEYIRSIDPSELTDSVSLPFPGSFTLADVLAYHYWNMSYHEGQIYYIGTLLAAS